MKNKLEKRVYLELRRAKDSAIKREKQIELLGVSYSKRPLLSVKT